MDEKQHKHFMLYLWRYQLVTPGKPVCGCWTVRTAAGVPPRGSPGHVSCMGGAGHFPGSCSHTVVMGTSSRRGGGKNHSLSLEKFLNRLLDSERQPHGSSARLGLHTDRGLILQRSLCFEMFAPPLRRSPGEAAPGLRGHRSPSPAHSPARADALLSPSSGSPG